MSWKGCVTNAGQNMINATIYGGHTLTITKATVGSGSRSEADMKSATALVSYVADAKISKSELNQLADYVALSVVVGPSSGSAYTAHEIGIWAKLDNQDPVLLYLGQDSDDGISIPAAADTPDFSFMVRIIVYISNQDGLSVTVDGSAYITRSVLDEELDLKVDTASVIDIEHGGTGASSAEDAREALGAASTDVATDSADGLMSAADKANFDTDHTIIGNITTDSGNKNLTDTSVFTRNTNYVSSVSGIVRKIGKLCVLSFSATLNTSVSAGTQFSIGTIAAAYRPDVSGAIYISAAPSNNSHAEVNVSSGGGIYVTLRGSNGSNGTKISGEAVYFTANY